MNCFDAEELVQRSLDGALTVDERRALEGHLEDCAACRRAREEYRLLSRLATTWTNGTARDGDPGDAFTAQVIAHIASTPSVPVPKPPPWRHRTLVPVALLGVVAALSFALGPYLFTTVAMRAAVLADLLPEQRTLAEAPGWLIGYLRALPQDGERAWAEVLRGFTLPLVGIPEALVAAVLLNALFFLHALRSYPRDLAR